MSNFCPTCQSDGCMRVGASAPTGFYLDMVGQIGYTCRFCGTRGWGPGTSPGLICSYEPGPIAVIQDGTAWCAYRKDGFTNIQECAAGFSYTSRLEAVKDLLKQEQSTARTKPAKGGGE